MKFHLLYHVPFEEAGSMEPWIKSHGHTLTATRLWNKEPLPPIDFLDFLIVMGGPMNIYEEKEYSWLKSEKRFIEKTVKAGKKVLGVCLGAQLIADVLGGKVYRNAKKEIGWLPIELTSKAEKSVSFQEMPKTMTVFHWHGDTFHLPPGALHLARSRGCENQAFEYKGRVVGLQFHLESTPQSVKALVENCKNELIDGPYSQPGKEILSNNAHYSSIQTMQGQLLEQIIRGRQPALRA